MKVSLFRGPRKSADKQLGTHGLCSMVGGECKKRAAARRPRGNLPAAVEPMLSASKACLYDLCLARKTRHLPGRRPPRLRGPTARTPPHPHRAQHRPAQHLHTLQHAVFRRAWTRCQPGPPPAVPPPSVDQRSPPLPDHAEGVEQPPTTHPRSGFARERCCAPRLAGAGAHPEAKEAPRPGARRYSPLRASFADAEPARTP